MKDVIFKKRNIWLQLVLLIVTLGFYSFYWFYSTNKELKKIDNKAPNPKTVLYIVISQIIVIILSSLITLIPSKFGLFSFILYLLLIPISIWYFVYFIFYLKSVFRIFKDVNLAVVILLTVFFYPGLILYLQSKYNSYYSSNININSQNYNNVNNTNNSININNNYQNYINQLAQYIKQYENQGHSEDEVKNILISKGYFEKDISNAINRTKEI